MEENNQQIRISYFVSDRLVSVVLVDSSVLTEGLQKYYPTEMNEHIVVEHVELSSNWKKTKIYKDGNRCAFVIEQENGRVIQFVPMKK